MSYINGWTKEKVIEHINKEYKGFSFDTEIDYCMYRADFDKKCVVGCFIPDDVYSVEMERKCANYLISSFHLMKYMPFSSDIMQRWQNVHDNFLEQDISFEQQKIEILNFLDKIEE